MPHEAKRVVVIKPEVYHLLRATLNQHEMTSLDRFIHIAGNQDVRNLQIQPIAAVLPQTCRKPQLTELSSLNRIRNILFRLAAHQSAPIAIAIPRNGA